MDFILLQAGGAGALMQFLPLLMILVVFYFFMIRPQMTRQKEQTAFTDSIEKGREVVTASGMIGKINKMDGSIVTLEVAKNVFIRVTKSSISKELTETFATALKDETNA
jgi:preprotein translocase subunit YajC